MQPSLNFMKSFGIPALAAALTFFISPLATDACESGESELSLGQENEQVEELQELLHERGYLEEEHISGEFDKHTEEALEEYQEEHNLGEDSTEEVTVDPYTIGALEILQRGDEGETVEILQEELNKIGFFNYKIDGLYGTNTYYAVRTFQKAAEITVDGLAGPETFSALVNEDYDKDFPKESTSVKASTKVTTHDHSVSEGPVSSNQSSQDGRTLEVSATAYTAYCNGCSGITATGVNLKANPNKKVIAVDPNVIPLGSKVKVEGHGTFTAADTGGAINGNKIDIFMPNKSDALNFGRQTLKVTVLD